MRTAGPRFLDRQTSQASTSIAWITSFNRKRRLVKVSFSALRGHPPTTFIYNLASRLRARDCARSGRLPAATLLQLAQRPVRSLRMRNFYSMTKNVDAIRRLFGALNSSVGNLPSMPGIFRTIRHRSCATLRTGERSRWRGGACRRRRRPSWMQRRSEPTNWRPKASR